MLVLFYGSSASAYAFYFFTRNRVIIVPFLYFSIYYFFLSFFAMLSLPVFLLFLINVCFIATDSSSVRLAKSGIKEPLSRLKSTSFGSVREKFKARLKVNGLRDFFLAINGPEERLLQEKIESFFVQFNFDQLMNESLN